MNATRFEFRFRVVIIFLLYAIGFVAPWQWLFAEPNRGETWGVLIAQLSRTHLLSFNDSFVLVNAAVLLCAFFGGLLRWWATAYLGHETVGNATLVAERVVAAGPYRYLRNPLYIGSWLLAIPLAILMRPSGAAFLMIALTIFLLRLVGAERAFLSAQLGEEYRSYRQRSIRERGSQPASESDGNPSELSRGWLAAAIAESYGLLLAVSFAVFCWRFNAQLLLRCALISYGATLVLRAIFLPRRGR